VGIGLGANGRAPAATAAPETQLHGAIPYSEGRPGQGAES
jgi:hypothetical protein